MNVDFIVEQADRCRISGESSIGESVDQETRDRHGERAGREVAADRAPDTDGEGKVLVGIG
jgi:hypothetical protein